MKQEKLNLLEELYQYNKNIVWILDENWNLLWHNGLENVRERNINEILKISEKKWINIKKQIYWKNRCFNCELSCFPEDELRVAVLIETKPDMHLTLDESSISNTIHAILMMENYLYTSLNEKERFAYNDLLRSMRGGCYQVHRTCQLQKLIKKMQNPQGIQPMLVLQEELTTICRKIEDIFNQDAEVLLDVPEQDIKIRENQEIFQAVITCGVVICCRYPYQYQHIDIKLKQISKNQVSIFIGIRSDIQEISYHSSQIDPSFLKSFEAEETLLTLFCNYHGGNWVTKTLQYID